MSEKTKKQETNADDIGLDLDLAGFGSDTLSTEQLKEVNKKLPKWNIEPPSKYKSK